jgi:hypothetical protein
MCRIKLALGALSLLAVTSFCVGLFGFVILFRFLALREPYKGPDKARIIADYESGTRTPCGHNVELLLGIISTVGSFNDCFKHKPRRDYP